MSAFSPEQQANLDHYGGHLSTELGRSGRKKSAVTERSRQNHFVGWATKVIGLKDPCMKGKHPQAQNYLLAAYGVALVTGETIKGTMLRKKTIARYISAVIKLMDKRGIINPRKSADTDLVQILLDAVGRYEAVEKRRNMISDEMMLEIIKQADNADPDGLIAALADWFNLGQYTGFRLSEWGQAAAGDYERIPHTPHAKAMIEADFVFKGPGKARLNQDDLPELKHIESVDVTWRHQKNGRNRQEITYTRNRRNPRMCGVAAALRIRNRARRLHNPAHYPMGIHRTAKGNRFITGDDTAVFLRAVASKVFNLNPKNAADKYILDLYSAHSIRVRAANLLHRQGMSDSYIMNRLRWTSMAFMDYLRNTIYAANQHNKLIDFDGNLPDMFLLTTCKESTGAGQ